MEYDEIDGVFYHVDVTWDVPAWDRIGYAQHDNFLLSDKGIIETGHEGWDIGITAYDASFEEALWQDSIGGVVFYEGYWYYVDSLKGILFKTDCMLDGETEVYNIFGFEIVGDDMGYVICSDAFPEGSFSEFTEYEELPFENIAGSVSLEGEERYDSALYEPLEVSASAHVDCVNHKWGNRKTLKKAACSIKGMEQNTCAYCGITNNKQIAATGLKVFTCTVCKKQKLRRDSRGGR